MSRCDLQLQVQILVDICGQAHVADGYQPRYFLRGRCAHNDWRLTGFAGAEGLGFGSWACQAGAAPPISKSPS